MTNSVPVPVPSPLSIAPPWPLVAELPEKVEPVTQRVAGARLVAVVDRAAVKGGVAREGGPGDGQVALGLDVAAVDRPTVPVAGVAREGGVVDVQVTRAGITTVDSPAVALIENVARDAADGIVRERRVVDVRDALTRRDAARRVPFRPEEIAPPRARAELPEKVEPVIVKMPVGPSLPLSIAPPANAELPEKVQLVTTKESDVLPPSALSIAPPKVAPLSRKVSSVTCRKPMLSIPPPPGQVLARAPQPTLPSSIVRPVMVAVAPEPTVNTPELPLPLTSTTPVPGWVVPRMVTPAVLVIAGSVPRGLSCPRPGCRTRRCSA